MKILIISGGNSSERKISLISARAAKKALEEKGHLVKLFDFKKGFKELKKTLFKFDVIFPVMHGREGEDGMLYSFLHSLGVPFVGSHPIGAEVAFDKILFKRFCDRNKFPTAEWKVIKNKADIVGFGFPCVFLAANGGSSREVALLNSVSDLEKDSTQKILQLNDHFYVERLLKGVEITAGILHDQALPLVEIVPPNDGWFDYQNKYPGETREIPHAPSVGKKVQLQAQEIALMIHQKLKLGSFSRTDIIVSDNTPFVLEVNTPGGVGLTPKSLFPKAAKAA